MKKLLIFSIMFIFLIGIISASALSALWKQGISAANPQAAQVISAADQIMEIQSLAQCATGLGAAACMESIIEQKAMGQVYGEAIKAAGPEVQKIISAYQQFDLYKQAGAEIIGAELNEKGEFKEGTIKFKGEKESDISKLIGKDLKEGDVSAKGVELDKREGVNTLTFTEKNSKVCIKENCFENIQSQNEAGYPTYLKLDENGEVIQADFTTNEKGGVFDLGEGGFYTPPNSRVYYSKKTGEPPRVKLAEDSILDLKQKNLQGGVYYEGKNFKIDDNEICGLSEGIGKVTFSNGKITKIWENTDAIVEGIEHKTFIGDLNLYYDENFDVSKHKSENYFDYGKNKIWLGGNGFSSALREGNTYGISLIPEDEEGSVIKQLRMERNLIFSPNNGNIRMEKVSKEGEQLSLFMRAEGGLLAENGNYEILSEQNNIYVKNKRKADILQDNMKVATDMRIEYLDNNLVRTYYMNTGKSTTKEISSEGIDMRKKELSELEYLKNYLKDRESQNLPEDEPLRRFKKWDKMYEYTDLQIKEKENEIKYGEELINPVFGEVISTDKVKISSSNFFTTPIIRKKDMQYFGGDDKYTGAAFIVAAESRKGDPAFGVAAQVSAEDLAKKEYYVLKMEKVISEYPQFFDMLENPNLHKFGKDIKINKVELYSHSWPSGLWLDHYGNEIHDGYIEYGLGKIGKKDLYYKYLSKEKLRNVNFRSLNSEQIKFIQNSFAKDAEFSYKGCNVGNFPSVGSTTYDVLGVRVEASPAGTYMQKFDNKKGVWTAFELDSNDNIIYSYKDDEVYNSRTKKWEKRKFRVPKEHVFNEGDTIRMHPNVDLLKREYIQQNLPGITGYLKIIDSKTTGKIKYYQLEYPTTRGIKKVWVDEEGYFDTSLN